MKSLNVFIPLLLVGSFLMLGNTSAKAAKKGNIIASKKVTFEYIPVKKGPDINLVDSLFREVFNLNNAYYKDIREYILSFGIGYNLDSIDRREQLNFIRNLKKLYFNVGIKNLSIFNDSSIKNNIYYLVINWDKIKTIISEDKCEYEEDCISEYENSDEYSYDKEEEKNGGYFMCRI